MCTEFVNYLVNNTIYSYMYIARTYELLLMELVMDINKILLLLAQFNIIPKLARVSFKNF